MKLRLNSISSVYDVCASGPEGLEPKYYALIPTCIWQF